MDKRKIIALIIILIGVIFLLVPNIINKYLDSKSDEGLDSFNHLSAEEISENDKKKVDEADFNFDNVEYISPSKAFIDIDKVNPELILGQIVIPSIDLNLTVFKGVSDISLWAGVGTMKPYQKMGEGNYAIAGHNSVNGALFSRLTEIKNGDIIKLTDKSTIYEYRVYNTRVALPTDIYMIDDIESMNLGKPILSLMNCHYENGKETGNRYFVVGELVNKYEYKEKKMLSK